MCVKASHVRQGKLVCLFDAGNIERDDARTLKTQFCGDNISERETNLHILTQTTHFANTTSQPDSSVFGHPIGGESWKPCLLHGSSERDYVP